MKVDPSQIEWASRETKALLYEWVRWSREGASLQIKTPLQRLVASARDADDLPPLSVTDDMAMRVDHAVTVLRQRAPVLAMALKLKYLDSASLSGIARTMKLSNRHIAGDYVNRAESFIDGVLTGATAESWEAA